MPAGLRALLQNKLGARCFVSINHVLGGLQQVPTKVADLSGIVFTGFFGLFEFLFPCQPAECLVLACKGANRTAEIARFQGWWRRE